jgi:hypothetical protein
MWWKIRIKPIQSLEIIFPMPDRKITMYERIHARTRRRSARVIDYGPPPGNDPSNWRDQTPRNDSALITLPHQQDTSSRPDKVFDTSTGDDDFEALSDVPNAHECFRDCTHCRACFNLDYDLYSRFSEFEGEREIESRLSDIATSAKNGCEMCSLLIRGAEIAFSADQTGKAFNDIRRSQVTIRVRRGRPVNLHFRIDDWELIELEYYTISGSTSLQAL